MKEINIDGMVRDRNVQLNVPVSREIKDRKEFSETEVGITHPDLNSFIRLNDKGDIEIFAAPGIGIVISASSKSVSIFADSIRLNSKEDGLRWNSYNFNYSASSYVEPTLVKIRNKDIHTAVNNIEYYMNNLKQTDQEETATSITIDSSFGFGYERSPEQQNLLTDIDYSGIPTEYMPLLEAYLTDYSVDHVNSMIKHIKDGLNFNQAHERALRESSTAE